jgi:hypothetical protein
MSDTNFEHKIRSGGGSGDSGGILDTEDKSKAVAKTLSSIKMYFLT